MIAEPLSTAILLTVFGVLMAFCVFFTRALDRLGIPVVLLFLILGMLGGSEGLGGIAFSDYAFAFRLGTVALVLILFDGALNTSWRSIRTTAGPAGILATVGVAGTAGLLAVIAHGIGLPWPAAVLVGAIVSSTDAAAVFAVLRGGNLRVKEKVQSTLEVESCVNDPMAVILTMAVVEALKAGNSPSWRLLLDVPVQLLVGTVVGIVVGVATRRLLTNMRIGTTGLYPVVTLASAFIAFGAATIFMGSGFLAVFAAGVVLGNGPLPYKSGLTRVHDALAWLSQVSMFLMLGLLVFPSQLIPEARDGLLLGFGLAIVARPVVVVLCLLPFRWPAREVAYVAWVGIRGAVPIVLATFPVMAELPGAERIFHIVFFIVVISALVPGSSIVPLTKWWKLDDPQPDSPTVSLEVLSLRPLSAQIHIYYIEESAAVCGLPLAEIDFPDKAAALMVIRGEDVLAARGHTVLRPGDHVYICCRPDDEPRIHLLFGRAAEE